MTDSAGNRIACLGEPMVELNCQPDGRYLKGFGGDTSNCAVAAARQGASVAYIGRLGKDPFGKSIRSMWREEGIDDSSVAEDPEAPTAVYFVEHSPQGHSFSYYRHDSAASRITPADLTPECFAGVAFLHVSGISLAISATAEATVRSAIDMVLAAGGRVSFDTNLRVALWPLERACQSIHAAMAQCQIALPSLEDARALAACADPDSACDFYLGLGCEIVCLTMGDAGTMVAAAGERQTVPALKVDAVDATGAGDTFDGAFLAQLALGADPFAAARYANAAAALSTLGYGAIAPMPTAQQTANFLAQANRS